MDRWAMLAFIVAMDFYKTLSIVTATISSGNKLLLPVPG
jgi:hypothetical protein